MASVCMIAEVRRERVYLDSLIAHHKRNMHRDMNLASLLFRCLACFRESTWHVYNKPVNVMYAHLSGLLPNLSSP